MPKTPPVSRPAGTPPIPPTISKKKGENNAMKFSCETALLQEGISMAAKAASGKSALPILEGLLIEAAGDGEISLCGFDLQFSIQTRVEAQVAETGRTVIDARLLWDIVRKVPEDTVFVEVDGDHRCTIKSGRAVYSIMAMDAEEYPALPDLESVTSFSLPQGMLKKMIAGTIFSVSENQAKPIHTGCLFEKEPGLLTVVAVDGYRLSIRRQEIEEEGGAQMKFVVPAFALKELERLLAEDDTPVTLRRGQKNILFELGGATLMTRLLNGEFLDWRQAVPQSQEYQIVCSAPDLTRCFDRVSLLVTERLKTPVRLTLDGHVMQLLCITSLGKSYDEYEFDGEFDRPMEIGFNTRYVLEALRACPEEQVKLCFTSPLNPMVIHPLEGEGFTYMILPVRLRHE